MEGKRGVDTMTFTTVLGLIVQSNDRKEIFTNELGCLVMNLFFVNQKNSDGLVKIVLSLLGLSPVKDRCSCQTKSVGLLHFNSTSGQLTSI